MKKTASVILIIAMVILSVACGKKESIVLASKPMTEQFLIAEMLMALIEQETDLEVEYKEGVGGGTSNIHPAMESGEVDIYPEYTGTGWMLVLKQDLIQNPDELYDEVKEAYAKEFNIYWSARYGFNNTFGLAMKRELAEALNIKTYSDLARESSNLIIGAEHDFFGRDDGFPGLVENYGFAFEKEVGMDIGLKYQAIESEEVDVINIFSTDGKLKEYDMVVLEDDLNFFPSYYAATLVRMETLEKYPELKKVIAMLDGAITNEEITNMNYLVEIERESPKDVAIEFLKLKGILK